MLLASIYYVEICDYLVLANPVLPSYLPIIIINNDGDLMPQTDFIVRNGSVYTLVSDLIDKYSIDVMCSNIVLNGDNYDINITTQDNAALRVVRATNVTVKNLEVFSQHNSILFIESTRCLLNSVKSEKNYIFFDNCSFSTVTKNSGKFGFLYCENNIIEKNNITALTVDFCNKNIFSKNNILYRYIPNSDFKSINLWDDGSIGNYWIDYYSKYPTSTSIDNTGILNQTYIINGENKDNYPLAYPYDISKDIIVYPTIPEVSWLAVIPLLFSIFIVALVIRHKKIAI